MEEVQALQNKVKEEDAKTTLSVGDSPDINVLLHWVSTHSTIRPTTRS